MTTTSYSSYSRHVDSPFVYFMLAVQFNSFRDPLVVLVGSVPLALAGALLFPFLGWTTIKGAAESRLRPVLMTTAATALGRFPLVLITGAGAEARNSIGNWNRAR